MAIIFPSCVLLYLSHLYFTDGALEVDETRLHKDLFDGYHKDIHPRLPGTGPVTVTFDFQLIRILDVSARDQFIITYAWVNQYWKNSFMKWNPEDYGGIKEIHVSPEDVWVPDTLLYNNIDEEEHMGGGRTSYTTNVAIRYDGSNTWLNPAVFKSICSVDVTNFPFDDQECLLKFGSWSFDITKIDLAVKNDSVLNKYYITNGEWQLLDISVKRNALKYQCCPDAFVDISVQVRIRRESLDYILKLIIPCSLISSMIFLGFVLPPESGERIGLSITVLLAMTVFQQLSSELMPSYGFPLLGQFYFAIMLEIGASLAVTTLILNFYHRNRRSMPKTMRKVILLWLARILFPCQKPKDWGGRQRRTNPVHSESLENNCGMDSDMSCNDDVFECQERKNSQHESHMHRWAIEERGSVRVVPKRDSSCGHHSFCFLEASPQNPCNSNGRLKNECHKWRRSRVFRSKDKSIKTKKSPSKSTKRLRRQLTMDCAVPEKLKNQKEWIKAARVLDRLFLMISIIVYIFTLLTIFLRAPRFHLE
ncbi:neuronal acetylcholine receptor subunit alpha-10-like [Montipora foliosa]|uniref:neuronal acetylcholine receptor subunit alpha-10-like n=1 Tax=Montipora foliosa TaxID=591990 RepID=UPI0035F144D6